ncbi:MAG: IPT/TIG domain-containing protein [Rikenellaceae bacterium]|nr:IPT/TIG domain-containing protein [Rikenellaceae bacterium]
MKTNKLFRIFAAVATIGMAGCCQTGGYEPPNPGYPCDPTQPVVFTDFMPKEGPTRTTMFIEGSNFGTDISNISVTIGGVKAVVVGSSGTTICLTVPRRCVDGDVKVVVRNPDGSIAGEHEFTIRFALQTSLQVGTLVGWIDPLTNLSNTIDGTFAEAGFDYIGFMLMDIDPNGHKVLYTAEESAAYNAELKSLRKIDLTDEMVSTVFRKGDVSSFNHVRSMTLSPTRDTMFFVDDHGTHDVAQWALKTNIYYALRSEGFKNVYSYLFGTSSMCCASMGDGAMFYSVHTNNGVYKARAAGFDPSVTQWKSQLLYTITTGDSPSNKPIMTRHPDDLYVYMHIDHAIYKCLYDPVTQTLGTPFKFVGDGWSYQDGVGANARFNSLRQGVFVYNRSYDLAGNDDKYDYYVCDRENNCIRKVTPDGVVSTYAGRGKGNGFAYSDGAAREEAMFNRPNGICYDEDEKIFYVADSNNKRIRTIALE